MNTKIVHPQQNIFLLFNWRMFLILFFQHHPPESEECSILHCHRLWRGKRMGVCMESVPHFKCGHREKQTSQCSGMLQENLDSVQVR